MRTRKHAASVTDGIHLATTKNFRVGETDTAEDGAKGSTVAAKTLITSYLKATSSGLFVIHCNIFPYWLGQFIPFLLAL